MRYFCSVLTVLLWWFAGQRFGLFAFGWIALAPLLWATTSISPWARWKTGYLTGIAGYMLINWWIIVAVTRGAPMIGAPAALGPVLGLVGILLIGLIQGVQFGLIALAWQPDARFAQRAPWSLPLLIGLLWFLLETVRSSTPLAHSWGALAFTQWRDTALLQSVSLVGQHGLSALCVWFAASLALWLRRQYAPSYLWRAPVLLFLALHVWGTWQLDRYDAATGGGEEGRSLRVLLVQTNVPSIRKNQEDASTPTPFTQAYDLTRQQLEAASGQPDGFDLVLWPETTVSVVTMAQQQTSSPLAQLGQTAQLKGIAIRGREAAAISELCREFGVSILTGANNPGSERDLYNMALLVAPDGGVVASSKQRLVPFGERAPFGDTLPLLNRFAPSPAVAPGSGTDVLPLRRAGETNPLPLGSLICFESCFPDPARQLRRSGARLLTVITNDEWFSGTDAPWEHAAMAAVRAVESRVPVVQAANGGYSFFVDPCGRFVINSSVGTAQTLAVTVPLTDTIN